MVGANEAIRYPGNHYERRAGSRPRAAAATIHWLPHKSSDKRLQLENLHINATAQPTPAPAPTPTGHHGQRHTPQRLAQAGTDWLGPGLRPRTTITYFMIT